ncbi:MAG: DUF3035 domain-containing protein [Paracoccaceae bacterium]|nr:DUF3035 domain-containing protein [Paracoccaceae bacterium]
MRALWAAMGLIVLAACGSGNKEPDLLNISQPRGAGPDEFAVLPSKPLVIPEDLATLPPPTPGGGNLTDPTPRADAAAALGGNAAVLARGATDGALLAYSGRYGVASDIRPRLAAEDLAFRRANDGRLVERLFNVNVYFRAYEPYELDQYAELERLRRAGIRTSAAPPDPALEE